MTTVRIQRSIYKNPDMPWIVHDQYHARECQILDKDIPEVVKTQWPTHPSREGEFAQFFTDAIWNKDKQVWDLKFATLTTWKFWR